MRKALVIVTTVLLVAFVLQFVFAAVGAFTRPAGDGAYALHSVTGMAVIPALTLLTTLFAVLAKAPGRLIGLAILPLGLVVVQGLIAMLANASTDAAGASTPFGLTIAGLHALNGIIAVHVVVSVHQAARKLAHPVPADTTPVTVREGEPA
ncbi:DUF6220 domain-containing protein [Micromonospora sp. DR5-3]|uniref:DUF6220 domain-containing protein n=1 Tax=unclassified Micromonospora TaxID=2617518 RepID=UPI0011DBB688|nr:MULTISPECIES: DUF6220 domain-containing protein [unclassified Micromonospora]MCW3819147.1 DUF6220 domain-containing protein [Micromonospora sp. DR5-3]TYC21816.1 hypothetical protein FXF52_23845 [Micromonospora sp. MP36]